MEELGSRVLEAAEARGKLGGATGVEDEGGPVDGGVKGGGGGGN
jgi:hypothetical protein